MSFSTLGREAVVGIAMLGITFATGVYIGKRYFMYRRKKSQKMFDVQGDPHRAYLLRLSLREHPSAKKLRKHLLGISPQDISSDAAQLLGNLAKLINSRKILDMGWSCGYNPLILALVLPSDGKVIANVRDTEDISHARNSWIEAGVECKIHVEEKTEEQMLGDGNHTVHYQESPGTEHFLPRGEGQSVIGKCRNEMDDLLSAGEAGTFDLVSINMANQQNCRKCYEKCLRLLKSRGILAIDGVLCSGAVLKRNTEDVGVQGIHQMNEAILRDARIYLSVLPLGDGLMLCFKL